MYWFIDNIKNQRFNYRIVSNISMISALSILSFVYARHLYNYFIIKVDKISLQDINYVVSPPANYGYMLLALNSLFLIYVGHAHTDAIYYMYLISAIGYILLASGNYIGLYLCTLYYICSIMYMYDTSTDRIGLVTKFGLLIYFGTHLSRHVMNTIKTGTFKMYSPKYNQKTKNNKQ